MSTNNNLHFKFYSMIIKYKILNKYLYIYIPNFDLII
jgi:hypothetical protein